MRVRSISVLVAGLLAGGTMAGLQGCSSDGGHDIAGQGPGNTGAPSSNEPTEGVELITVSAPRASSAPAGTDKAVVAKVTVRKADILGKDFLYGADLQYSAKRDAELELTLQSLAIGHDIVRFSVVGENLHMVVDQSHQFESDVNKPGRLVHSYKILGETTNTLTFEIAQGSPILASVVDGESAPKERTSWVRDVRYVKGQKLLMFATSIESGDGGVYEFLESVFPRETLVPQAYTPLSSDPLVEPLAERFHFLTWGSVWVGQAGVDRQETQFANRFKLDRSKPLEWYVTSNIPDEYLLDVKNGVEGWNRYSRAMWNGDMVTFKGKLPADVLIGDPRYNIINWDNVAEAGAAYESQASDPLTGIQSHSLIYLPLAWVNIGRSFWEQGELSEAKASAAARTAAALKGRSLLGRPVTVNCLREPSAQITLEAKESPEQFGKALLKGTLFHELGHAWGLAHNFKGSLTLDDDTRSDRFTSSIMDYNHYNLERFAFDGPNSATGRLLEYDRQAISVLYNEGADVKPSDPVLPVCSDDEADDQNGGVDPLCIRYDAGADPTRRAQGAIALVTTSTATQGTVMSLPVALRRAATALGSPASVTTIDAADAALAAHAASLRGLLNFYFLSGANSIRYATYVTLPLLYVYKPGTLPAGLDEGQLRARTFESLSFVAGLEALPPATSAALNDAVAAAEVWFKQTAAYGATPAAERTAATDAALLPIRNIRAAVEGPAALLTRVRRSVLGSLVRVPTAPFAYQSSPVRLDYEEKAIAVLERGITTKVGGVTRVPAERQAYINALVTFADTDAGAAALGRVRAALEAELAAAPDARTREALRDLLKSF